jgi:hypothetical protein
MRFTAKVVFIIATAAGLGACRQADGPIPAPNATVREELVDVRRDLQNIAGKNPTAPAEFADDIRKYARRPAAVPAIEELARRTTTVLQGKKVSDQAAERLAQSLWTSLAATEISERQVESLQNDVHSQLVAIGVSEENAQQVAAQIGEVQKAATDRPRRWYEWF